MRRSCEVLNFVRVNRGVFFVIENFFRKTEVRDHLSSLSSHARILVSMCVFRMFGQYSSVITIYLYSDFCVHAAT